MDPVNLAATSVVVAGVFVIVQHLTVLKLTRKLDMLHDAVVAIAEGKATVRVTPHGEIEIKGIS